MDLEPIGGVDAVSGRVVVGRAVDAGEWTVWRAVSEPEGLSAWLGRLEGLPLGVGVAFDLWHEEEVRSTHEVLEWLPPRSLTVSWGFPGETPSRVRLTVKRDGAGSVVTLEHEGAENPVAYAAGWHVHLDFLVEYLRGCPRSFDGFWSDYDELVERYGARYR